MKTIILTIFLSFLCSVGYGEEKSFICPWCNSEYSTNPECSLCSVAHDERGVTLKESNRFTRDFFKEDTIKWVQWECRALRSELANLKAEVEELRKMIESKHASKDTVNRYECGCRP